MDALRDKNLLNLYLKEVKDEKDIISFCQANKYLQETLCTDEYLQKFLRERYPNTDFQTIKRNIENTKRYKDKPLSWKQFFLILSYYKGKLKEEYNYDYKGGDFKEQYKVFSDAKDDPNLLLRIAIIKSPAEEYVNIAKYALDREAKPTYSTAYNVAKYGRLDILKLMIERGLDVHIENDIILKSAAAEGHINILEYLKTLGVDISKAKVFGIVRNVLPTIKYLVENGADIHYDNEKALRFYASKKGNLEIVKYLVENGANIHVYDDTIFKSAERNGDIELLNYLKTL